MITIYKCGCQMSGELVESKCPIHREKIRKEITHKEYREKMMKKPMYIK